MSPEFTSCFKVTLASCPDTWSTRAFPGSIRWVGVREGSAVFVINTTIGSSFIFRTRFTDTVISAEINTKKAKLVKILWKSTFCPRFLDNDSIFSTRPLSRY